MAAQSSVDDVFRFIQLRPQRAVRGTGVVVLVRDTALVKDLGGELTMTERARLANRALADSDVRSVDDVPLGPEITAAIADLRAVSGSNVNDLAQALPRLEAVRRARDFGQRRADLSDLLIAGHLATEGVPAELEQLREVYLTYHLADSDGSVALGRFLDRPLQSPLPPLPSPTPARTAGLEPAGAAARPTADRADDEDVEQLAAAVDELVALDRPDALVQPDRQGATPAGSVAFALDAAARKQVSRTTATVLRRRGIDLAEVPLDVAVATLTAELSVLRSIVWPRPSIDTVPGATIPAAPGHALLRPAGVADLLVVKQQIKRYEAGEIAHVENVLIGEKKSRAHRRLERTEESFLTETESTRTQETELETADRFELNRETSRTVKADQKTSAGLSLSGKYGPTVDFSSKLETSAGTAQEESTKSSTSFARDVVSRSLERVTERVREVRTRTVIKETEETNLHELDNETGEHVTGIYQFLDKVYEAQVFNYGIRQMFDFMVPEPASFLWYVEANPTLDVDLPPAPPRLDLVAPDASSITVANALGLAAAFGATDVEPAPEPYALVTANLSHGEDDADEVGQPHSTERVDLAVPTGYRPLRARIRGLAFTDENPVIAVNIGSRKVVWKPSSANRIGLSAGKQLVHEPVLTMSFADDPYELAGESKLGLSVLAWETATYNLELVLVVIRTPAELTRWRVATYRKIRTAYEDRVREHEQRVQELRAEAEARAERQNRLPFGAPPAANRSTITTELKKHCLSIITAQRFDAFDATRDGKPPWFDFIDAAAEGAFIRFFEQSFEWDQLQYVCYPYFWSRKSTWVDRFVKQDVDPEFLDFLRAGSARVVVPVRPGFEIAVTHFLETGKIWGGAGDPPKINSPLYVSIIDEIRERTGAPQGEIPVGEPWEVRVPTALAIIRSHPDLPSWQRTTADDWAWQPVESS